MEAKFGPCESLTKYVKLGKDKTGSDVRRRGLCQGQLEFLLGFSFIKLTFQNFVYSMKGVLK